MEWVIGSILIFIGGFLTGGSWCFDEFKKKLNKDMVPFIADDGTLQWRNKNA